MKTIITIGRQFGSGGKEVGIRVAKELGIPFYDKELLQEAAKKSGLCQKIFENFDERPKSLIQKTDKRRASYYEYYSSQKWGTVESYDFCLDSSVFGIDGTVALIEKLVEMKEAK